MSMADKLKLVQLVDRKTLLPNELRAIMNLPPVPWGDEPLFWQDPKGEANLPEGEKEEENADSINEGSIEAPLLSPHKRKRSDLTPTTTQKATPLRLARLTNCMSLRATNTLKSSTAAPWRVRT